MKLSRFYIPQHLLLALVSFSLVSCGNGTYSETPPDAKKWEALAALDSSPVAATAGAKTAYIFSDNIIEYNPPCPQGGCIEFHAIGNPIHAYSFDRVSGMPLSVGIEVDTPAPKTKSLQVSASDRFMYVLTGDELLQTYSIGYSIFTSDEFVSQNLDPLQLYNELAKAGFVTAKVYAAPEIVGHLNTLLERPGLYDEVKANYPALVESPEVSTLSAGLLAGRNKDFAQLSEPEQKAVIRLNRLLLETLYPGKTPLNKGARAQHAIGPPLSTPPAYRERAFAAVELEPLGQFVYVLGRKVTHLPAGSTLPVTTQGLAVYSRNPASGVLALLGTQPFAIDQLLFAPSGTFAYGSNNGTLQAYSVNRTSGLLTKVGTPISFTAWQAGPDFNAPGASGPWHEPPFKNMAIDPTGKYLYLIASSGTQYSPDPFTGICPAAYHQLGSLIYTFIVDGTSGRLTQAGPPLDTTPHVMTALSVDPLGRFVQLLNTHEYYGASYVPGTCENGSTSPLNVGALYSNYVDQASGRLIPSGTVQAGGTQIPTGFVAAGANSVALATEDSGRFLYLLNGGDMYYYNVDQANGALTVVGSPLTGAVGTALPGPYTPASWPAICFSNGVLNGYCRVVGSRAHSLTWAGY